MNFMFYSCGNLNKIKIGDAFVFVGLGIPRTAPIIHPMEPPVRYQITEPIHILENNLVSQINFWYFSKL